MNLGGLTPKSKLLAIVAKKLPYLSNCISTHNETDFTKGTCTMYFHNLTKKEMHLMIFSQNALAESWYICCGLSYPLLAPTKGELSGPGDMSCSLELSAKPKPTSDPGWEVSPRWLWIIQSCKEAETSPHPNLTGQQEGQNLLSHGNASSASTQGESCWWRWGRQSNASRGLALDTETDTLHRSVGHGGSVPDPDPPFT